MGQALFSRLPLFMYRIGPTTLALTLFTAVFFPVGVAQTTKPTAADPAASVKKGIHLVAIGRCNEALPILKKSAPHMADNDLKLKAGSAAVGLVV